MKKILILVIGAILFASCSTQQKLPPAKDTVVTKIVGRYPVEAVEGLLVLHPVKDVAQGDGKNYNFFYDYSKRYLHITDEDGMADTIRGFLSERITADSIGHSVTLQSATIDPFSSLTDEVRKKITQTKGVEFNPINQYQIAKSFNIRVDSAYIPAITLLLNMLQPLQNSTPSIAKSNRYPIDGAQGLLTFHPIRNLVKGLDGKDYYFFLDVDIHYIFITDDITIYEKFSEALKVKPRIKNAVIVQGMSIDPIVFFSEETRKAMEKDQGFELNGGTAGRIDINNFNVATIDNYAVVVDYPKVINKLQIMLQTSVNKQLPATPDFRRKYSAPVTPKPAPKSSDPNRPFDPNE